MANFNLEVNMTTEIDASADTVNETNVSTPPILAKEYIVPFILVASLFPLWGFANDITNPLVAAFKQIFQITNTQSSMVQFAFYLGYGIMAIPAAIFIRKFSYKAGILLGLGLYAVGAMLFIPASLSAEFNFFLLALCTLTCGLALLETTANPYVLSMGHEETSTQRLNLAQAFNPIGSLTGMFIASTYILNELQVEAFRAKAKAEVLVENAKLLPSQINSLIDTKLSEAIVADPSWWASVQAADLATVRGPYVAIGCVVALLFVGFLVAKLPRTISHDHPLTMKELGDTFGRLFKNRRYLEGVVAQAFYVGAQIMCWTFVIHYGVMSVGMTAAEAQDWNMVAMGLLLASRFICTFLLGFVRPGQLLMALATGGILLSLGTIFIGGYTGFYCLIGISACMSLMFPTIYGIALKGMGDDASLASAGLVMAIVGGALMPPMQGSLIDGASLIGSIPSVQTSFVLPLICFIVIAIFGYRAHNIHKA